MTKHAMRKIVQLQLAQIVQGILSRVTSLPSPRRLSPAHLQM
jgi:hypothetical protein